MRPRDDVRPPVRSQLPICIDIVLAHADRQGRDVERRMQDAEEDEGELRRHRRQEGGPARLREVEVGIEAPEGRIRRIADVEHPPVAPEVEERVADRERNRVEDGRHEHKVGGHHERMADVRRDDAEEDGERERDEPERDHVRRAIDDLTPRRPLPSPSNSLQFLSCATFSALMRPGVKLAQHQCTLKTLRAGKLAKRRLHELRIYFF